MNKKTTKFLISILTLAFLILPSISFGALMSVVSDITATSAIITTGNFPQANLLTTTTVRNIEDTAIEFTKSVKSDNYKIAKVLFTGLMPDTEYQAKITYAGGTESEFGLVNFKTLKSHNLVINLTGDHPAGSSIQASVGGVNLQDGNCSTDSDNSVICDISIADNSFVMLTQHPASDAQLTQWGGNCLGVGVNVPCYLSVNSDKNVIAVFNKTNIIPPNSNQNPNQPKPTVDTDTDTDTNITYSSTGALVPCGTSGGEDCGFKHIFELINKVVTFILFVMAVPIAAIMFAYAGFLLITSGGETSKRTKAKKIFTNVAIGIILAVGAFLIVKTILSLVGYNTGSGWQWFGF